MKLAEALLLRADIQKKTVVQEGERPAEDPNEILKQVATIAGDLYRLVFAINSTNLQSRIASGESITEALAKRDSLALHHRILVGVVESCTKPIERYGVKEIRWVATIDVPAIQKRIDDMAKEIRELNAAIQEAGWRVDLAGY